MSRIFSAPAFETPELVKLREEINAASDELDTHVREQRDARHAQITEYERLFLLQRPEYPTADQRAGLQQIAALVHSNTPYGTFHGQATAENQAAGRALPEGLAYDSKTHRINVYASAPFKVDSTTRLWELSDEEIDRIRETLIESGLRITTRWRHDDGVAFIIVAPLKA